jgi:WhiB family transcriptional regulator, redox-sensing transcriptional regulator
MVAARRHWRSAAACRVADPDLFFPVSSSGPALEQVAEAKEVCARCQVRPECLAFALRTRQVHGVWGGMSEQERYLLWSRDERRIDGGAGDRNTRRLRPETALHMTGAHDSVEHAIAVPSTDLGPGTAGHLLRPAR